MGEPTRGDWRKPIGEYVVDQDFAIHFRHLHQVFMYITDRCNLDCKQCIYKPSIGGSIREEIPFHEAFSLLRTFFELGARKVTFLGGEPTMYGHCEEGKPLLRLIEGTKRLGYEYVRLDTNGQKISNFLLHPQFSMLDEIAFSLDGFSPEINDPLRGWGTFRRAVDSLRLALSLDYRVTITCCVQKILLTRDEDGVLLLEKMIRFAEELGAQQINFHDLFKVGVPMDAWTGDFGPKPEEWVPVYDELSRKIERQQFRISVRLPQCFVTKSEFDRNPEYYGYCPVKLGERVMVHPNGRIRICSNLICTGYGIARYYQGKIEWDHSSANELASHDLTQNTPCTNRSRHGKYGDLVPLCFSFKPGQDEFVWNRKLDWEKRRMLLPFVRSSHG